MNSTETNPELSPVTPKNWEKLTVWGILATGLIVIALTASDYGIGWDEYSSSHYAELVANYFTSGGRDTSCNNFFNLFVYGPTVDLLATAIYANCESFKYEIRHGLAALFALLTFPAMVKIGQQASTRQTGIIAGVILLLLPRFYGHAFINTKDIPFTCGFIWTVSAALSATSNDAQSRVKPFLVLGVMLGLTTSIRPGGWLLFGILLPLFFASESLQRFTSGLQPFPREWFTRLTTVAAVAWGVMVIPWPWAHQSPLLHPIMAILTALNFHAEFPLLFEGETHSSLHLPWYYLIKTIAITLPIPVIFFCLIGLVKGSLSLIQSVKCPAWSSKLAMLLWATLPITIWTLTRSNIYDGMRHFLFVLPAIAFWAALGVQTILDWAKHSKLRHVVYGAMTITVLSPVWSLVKLHPYQMAYFNSLVGGLRGAEGTYETDYWATSFRAAAEWLNEQQAKSDKPLRVLVVANKWNRLCIEHYLDEQITMTLVEDVAPHSDDIPVELAFEEYPGKFPQDYDFLVASYRANQSRYYPESPVVHTIGRDGATFAVIKSQPRQ